jgi:hypothetical protein
MTQKEIRIAYWVKALYEHMVVENPDMILLTYYLHKKFFETIFGSNLKALNDTFIGKCLNG